MRYYIKKIGDESFIIAKETLWQSLLSDFVTAITMLLLIGLDALFSIYVGRSFIIDFLVAVLFVIYIVGMARSNKDISTKEDIHKFIDEL